MKHPYVYGTDVWSRYPNVKISIEQITKTVAESMLQANVSNRRLARSNIARAITSDEWGLNGATIVFSDEGVLLDGQHRLMAVVETDIPITSIVVRGIPKEAQISMDTGKIRKPDDFLQMMGYKNSKLLAAAASALYRIECGGSLDSMFRARNKSDSTLKEVVQYAVDHNDEIQPWLRLACRVRNKYKGVETATVVAFIFEAKKNGADEDDIRYFFDQLLDVEIPSKPTMLLKKRLSENSMSKTGRLPQRVICAFLIKSWNSYVYGDEPTFLRFTQSGKTPESFPIVVNIGGDA